MKAKKWLFFLFISLCLLGCTNNSLADSDADFFDNNFKRDVIDKIAIDEKVEVIQWGETAVHKGCVAIFRFVGTNSYGNLDNFFVVIYFSKEKWKIERSRIHPDYIFKAYPEARLDLIKAGYFPK
jgi:hypothetical protein